jgi:hypothetical protein
MPTTRDCTFFFVTCPPALPAVQHMFELFFQQLRLLSENDENFPKRFALLESLATLKMPLLLVELCGASDDTDRDDSPLLSLFDTILGVQLYGRVRFR